MTANDDEVLATIEALVWAISRNEDTWRAVAAWNGVQKDPSMVVTNALNKVGERMGWLHAGTNQ